MSSIFDIIYVNYIKKYQYIILLFILFIIFVIAGYYAYNKFYTSKNNPLKDIANVNKQTNEGKTATVYFFHVDWCPHCQTAKPEWEKFKTAMNGKIVNGFIINCDDHECSDKSDTTMGYINEFNIEHYPTIKMTKDGQIYSFEGKITQISLTKFVNAMIV
jgi:thiol-disulfide isomerase/thioredoxin